MSNIGNWYVLDIGNYLIFMSIVFFGSSIYVIPIIETLNTHYDLSLIITTEKLPNDPIPAYCLTRNIPYRSIASFDKNTKYQILNTKYYLGIVADFGLIIPKELLDGLRMGVLNVHPSLLPKYRGATPVQQAILNGDKETGVSIIKLDEKLDHGPILFQEKEPILPSDTAETLYKRLFKKGAQLLIENINKYLKGEIKLIAQNEEKATYTKRLKREDGYIDLEHHPSKEMIKRMIRAYYPWPGAWIKFKVQSSKFKVIKFLTNEKIQVEGKKPMSYKDFINGYASGKEILEKLRLV